MKKLALILLTSIYMLSVIGIGVSQFFCCGKLQQVNFSLKVDEFKTCKKDTKDDGCCKTVHKFFKVADSHTFSDVSISFAKDFPILDRHSLSFDFTSPAVQQSVASSNNINAPPRPSSQPIYILNCSYRIWYPSISLVIHSYVSTVQPQDAASYFHFFINSPALFY